MFERHKRYYLKDKEAKALLKEASRRLKINLEQLIKTKINVEVVDTDFAHIYLINGEPLLAKTEETIFPTLIFNEFFNLAPKAVVDMGAVPYVCNGANIMAPGIRRIEGKFAKEDFVFIVDERHHKPLAVSKSLHDLCEAEKTKQGIVFRNIHFVGDKIWNHITRKT